MEQNKKNKHISLMEFLRLLQDMENNNEKEKTTVGKFEDPFYSSIAHINVRIGLKKKSDSVKKKRRKLWKI